MKSFSTNVKNHLEIKITQFKKHKISNQNLCLATTEYKAHDHISNHQQTLSRKRSRSIVTLKLDMKLGGRPFYLIEACTISNFLSGKNRKNFVPILIWNGRSILAGVCDDTISSFNPQGQYWEVFLLIQKWNIIQ